MKNYSAPSIVLYGEATDLIQGCGGWGVEGWGFNDSDKQWRWVSTDKVTKCICTTLRGNGSCKP